ncbi:MAG: gliding motility lipoprotein GldH [Bacteroidales bacterium]|nr:gliding motility lipoprotein GldH [Bacteroidales bacterium]
MNFRHLTIAVLGACLCCLFYSCTDPNDFEEHHILENENWSMHDPITFAFDIADTSALYQFGMHFRYTDTFPWQDLFLFMQTTLPDGRLSQDTLHCFLFGPDGKPLGKGHRVKELKIGYSLLRFPMPGHYSLRFTQGMRAEKIRGIASIGISLKKTESVTQ